MALFNYDVPCDLYLTAIQFLYFQVTLLKGKNIDIKGFKINIIYTLQNAQIITNILKQSFMEEQ